MNDLKHKIGDKFFIKSKILPYEEYDEHPCDYYRVCTSCSNGYDRFMKDKCRVEDGYVIHEVYIASIDTYLDGRFYSYHVKNVDKTLSRIGESAWQGCTDEDIYNGEIE